MVVNSLASIIKEDLDKAFAQAEDELFVKIRFDKTRKICKGCSYLNKCLKKNNLPQICGFGRRNSQKWCKSTVDQLAYRLKHPEKFSKFD